MPNLQKVNTLAYMNRLILIGNGFDLAHGMKTSYIEFIKWYMVQRIKAAANGETKDVLIEILPTSNYRGDRPTSEAIIADYVNACYENGFNLNKFGRAALDLGGQSYRYPYIFHPQSRILIKLIKQCSVKRWVDVESIFYETLLDVLDAKITPEKKEIELRIINESMRVIIRQLEIYLTGLPKPAVNQKYNSILFDYIEKEDLESLVKGEEQVVLTNENGQPAERGRATKTHILNFNYTDTIELYVNKDGRTDPDITLNYIHGELNSSENRIVFGFGDEIDKRYAEIENEKAYGYFEHIKSFSYLQTSRYKDLVRFVDGEQYQLVILGHSCGLSDRTMLRMLLEHVNCKSIKLYYHETETGNNYTELTYEIARHFHNKALMRKRIISRDKSTHMPQP